jgi:hypothetical protein
LGWTYKVWAYSARILSIIICETDSSSTRMLSPYFYPLYKNNGWKHHNFVKSLRRLIYDVQYMMLLKIITNVVLWYVFSSVTNHDVDDDSKHITINFVLNPYIFVILMVAYFTYLKKKLLDICLNLILLLLIGDFLWSL